MGSFRTWSLAIAAGIVVVTVAHQRSHADNVQTPVPVSTPPVAARVQGLPDFSGLVTENGPAVVNIEVTEKPQHSAGMPNGGGSQGGGGQGGGSQGGGSQGGGGADDDDPISQFFKRFGQQPPSNARQRPATGIGSGFIVSSDGLILTNAHVVAQAQEVTVKLNDRREFSAKVVGVDKPSDVALIRIAATGLPVVHFGDPSKLKPGQWAIAIGSPFGFDSSVTAGVISATGRPVPDESGYQYVTFIQTDAAVNPGNSGGPLFNIDGQVVGINSQIYSRTGGYMGVSFAIPIDIALNVKDQLLKNGKVSRSRIGVQIQDLKQQLAQSFGLSAVHGALIAKVEPGGPGDQAGLKPGDVITSVNGKMIDHSWDLPAQIAQLPPGSQAKLGVWHEKKATEVTVKTILLEDSTTAVAKTTTDEGGSKLGLTLRPLDPKEQQELHTKGKLVVEDVAGPALAAGIEQGDVILGVNGTPVASLADLKREVAKAGKNVALLVQNEAGTRYIPIDVG